MIDRRDVESEIRHLFVVEGDLRSDHAGLRIDANVSLIAVEQLIGHPSVVSLIGIAGVDTEQGAVARLILFDLYGVSALLESRGIVVVVEDLNVQLVEGGESRLPSIRENQMQMEDLLNFAIEWLVAGENERGVREGPVNVEGKCRRGVELQFELQRLVARRRSIEVRGNEISDDHIALGHFGFRHADANVKGIRVIDQLDRLQGEIPGEQRRTIIDILHIDDHVGIEWNVKSIIGLND